MKSAQAVRLEFEEPVVLEASPKEENLPPWRVRLRLWFAWLSNPRLVRLVAPNERALERYEFEKLRADHAINRVF